MTNLSWANTALVLVLLATAFDANSTATQGQENKPSHNRKEEINDDLVTARADFARVGDQLLAENRVLVRLIEEFEGIRDAFKALAEGPKAKESANQIVRERNALIKKIEALVVRIRTQEKVVDRLELSHEAQARRVEELERAQGPK